MKFQATIAAAIQCAPPTRPASAAAIDGVREFLTADTDVAANVARFVNLRQAAGETPIAFVKRIVGAYITEALEADDGWAGPADTADNDNEPQPLPVSA